MVRSAESVHIAGDLQRSADWARRHDEDWGEDRSAAVTVRDASADVSVESPSMGEVDAGGRKLAQFVVD